jgi:hypothetical protein
MERASLGCSRVRREIPSGLNQQWPETGRIALSSECSYRFVVCMSRVMASRSSRSGRGARCARAKRVLTHSSDPRHPETDAVAPNKNQGQNLGMGAVTAFFSRRESACRRDSAREHVLRRPYPGRRRACSTNEVRPFLCEEKPPPTRYEGRAVESGSESGMTGFARTTASEVPGRAFLRHSMRAARSRGPWLAPKAIHTARASDTEAALVKNEGASPLMDARTDRVEEGSDDAT